MLWGGLGRRCYLEELGHGSALLFCNGLVFLLDYAEAGYGEFEVDF